MNKDSSNKNQGQKLLKNYQKVRLISKKIKSGPKFFSFTYIKENGEKSHRTVSFGIDVAKRMEKQGTPIKGTGNWHKGMTEGKLGFIVRKGKEWYVRGIDINKNEFRLFKVKGMFDLKG